MILMLLWELVVEDEDLDDALDEVLEVLRWRRDFGEGDFFVKVKKKERKCNGKFIYEL